MVKKNKTSTAIKTTSFDSQLPRFIEIEFLEINEHLRTTIQIIVGWYTFYITASVAGVISIVEHIADNKSIGVMAFYFSLAYIASSIISLLLVNGTRRFFSSSYSRLGYLLSLINRGDSDFIMRLPNSEKRMMGMTVLMNTSILLMLLCWLGLFGFACYTFDWRDLIVGPFEHLKEIYH